ncbi:MAG: Trigger factor [Parcubacteria group bacterium]|nr:Trigger factor [Parcubacteria group bacterium]
MSKHFKNLKVEKLPESEANITGELTLELLESSRAEALKNLNEAVSIPGFRKGHVPEDVLVKHVGETHVLEEVSEIALAREYPHIIEESKLSPIGRPQISITKLAPGIPLEFRIHVSLEPEFSLPDYKQIAKAAMSEAEDTEVTEKEIEDVLKEVEERGVKADLKDGETLEGKIKENLLEEKKFRAKEKKRLKLVEDLVKETKVAVPKVLIEAELEKMLLQFKDDVQRMGMQFDAYLKELKKTELEVKDEWRPQAESRVKAEMIVAKIADEEKITPTEGELEHEATHLLEHYPEADPLRVRIYIYTQLRNQKVLEFLESQN